MFEFIPDPATPKPLLYSALAKAALDLTGAERDPVANMANIAALIWQFVPELNWAGFYRAVGDELVLGPFVGKPACVRIAFGQGFAGLPPPPAQPRSLPMCTPLPATSPATPGAGPNWSCR